MNRRYSVSSTADEPFIAFVNDSANPGVEKAIFRTAALPTLDRSVRLPPRELRARIDAEQALEKEVKTWLQANKPDYLDPFAYWEKP